MGSLDSRGPEDRLREAAQAVADDTPEPGDPQHVPGPRRARGHHPQEGSRGMTEPCMFPNLHEPFYCRIHADVRLRLTDERCRRGVTFTQPQPDHAITPECGPICMTTGHHHDPEACDGCRRLADVMHAAGAGVPVSGDGLDVERLRKALIACGWPTVSQPRYAARIAREYAVLRSTPVAPKEDNRE